MSVALPSDRAGVSFELDGLEVHDGRLVVTGRWDGVRGLRFVRPALVVDDRQLLATLDDKPWFPDADPWRAAFPWEGPVPRGARVELAVAPSVSVHLQGAPVPAPVPDPAPAADAVAARAARGFGAEVAALRGELDALAADRDALRERLARAEGETDAARRATAAAEEDARRAALEAEAEARRVSEAREQQALREERARAQERARAEDRAAAEAEARRLAAQAEFTAALAAPEPPEPGGLLPQTPYASPTQQAPRPQPRPDLPDEAPAGIVAATHVPADPAPRDVPGRLTRTDLWAIRVLGAVTAFCFLALLAGILRLFL